MTRFFFFFPEIVRQTRDLNIHVILIDYESSDINIEEALRRSTIQSYTIVKITAETSFQRGLALHRGAQAVTDPHSILFLCDLHLKIPPDLISTIRKVRLKYVVVKLRERPEMSIDPRSRILICFVHAVIPFNSNVLFPISGLLFFPMRGVVSLYDKEIGSLKAKVSRS